MRYFIQYWHKDYPYNKGYVIKSPYDTNNKISRFNTVTTKTLSYSLEDAYNLFYLFRIYNPHFETKIIVDE